MSSLKIRRPHWRDPRLGVGVVLVAVAVALGAWTFAQADRTEPVYQASRVLTPGEPLDSSTLTLTRARLTGLSEHYLTPDTLEPGSVATRTIGARELVPAGAAGDPGSLDLRPMTVTTTAASPLSAGSVVDVWVAAPDPETRAFADPELLARELTVRSVTEDTSVFAVGGGQAIEVLVPEELVAALLDAINSGAAVSVVPLLGSAHG
ncbi:hypothetical protein [Pseudactinotalea sp. HY158]|uniref:hypothetical protein n=1 Tax=Pseudactinotalea sp. HY158 TaxID=2654547 RepID=UPI00129CE4FC|nr:hypothetical protein [Pseudactinotalea sp. HY158]QGH68862.1 hypothetical protein GCE65_04635 [Pseudactinotalea sp. HY158]